jgi:hypothetical protein
MTKEVQNPNDEMLGGVLSACGNGTICMAAISSFEPCHSFVIRHSSFVISSASLYSINN